MAVELISPFTNSVLLMKEVGVAVIKHNQSL